MSETKIATPEDNKEFREKVENLTNLRLRKAEVFNQMVVARERVKVTQYAINTAADRNQPVDELRRTYGGHQAAFENARQTHLQVSQREEEAVADLHSRFNTQVYQIGNLDDQVPILFFPVRLETTFKQIGQNYELWVRIFPDDIAVETHEPLLTQDEIEQGQAYWISSFNATPIEKKQAWDLLCRSYGSQRAAWVALSTKPANFSTAPDAAHLISAVLSPKADSWTLQPVTRVMPDVFVINCYTGSDHSRPSFSAQTNIIPDEVKLGFDPSNNTNGSFYRSGTDIATDANDQVDWMIDFDAAVAKGLGAKVPISREAFGAGFERIIAVGVKASLTKEAGQARLQNLIQSHHYTDGFSLLKQGTSTNNTENEYSGYSSVDFGNTTTYATEAEANLFTPVTTARNKTDGQLLCEALGIDFDPLYHIYHAGGYDIRDAMNFNNSLWLSAMGYYLVNLAAVDTSDSDKVREFFNDFVRGRGALPSIRSGVQPYGILPASVYSRMAWSQDPNADIYVRIKDYATSLSPHWVAAVDAIRPAQGDGNSSQSALSTLAKNAVSLNHVQRIGFGSNLIWNYLVYNTSERDDSDQPRRWYEEQSKRLEEMQANTGIRLAPSARIGGINFLENHGNLSGPLVAPEELNRQAPLPSVSRENGFNYFQVLSAATFTELRDENYSRFGLERDTAIDAMLYRVGRQTLLLEYHDAACKLLRLPESERKDPELINMPVREGEREPSKSMMPLSAGASRWAQLQRPYGGFDSITDFIDARGREIVGQSEEPIHLFEVKEGFRVLAERPVADLELLSSELIDVVSHRLDTWQLALVNQRLNVIRGIKDGSTDRRQGIYLGAYGWVENVKPRTRTPVPTAPNAEFPLPLELDSPNEGYIHTPSLNQAAAAAVLRSGYATRGNTTTGDTLSVNIASERIRYSLDILEGLKNGQSLSVLLGYAFERFMYENSTYPAGIIIDPFIDSLRVAFALPVNTVNYTAPTPSAPNQAQNVLDGQRLINAFQAAAGNLATMLTTAGIPASSYPAPVITAIGKGIDWMRNLIDAVGDLSTAEGIFQLVQGNQAKSGAIADAIAKGNNMPEIDVINTPRSGIAVNQRFTLHLENNAAMSAGWSNAGVPMSPRATAEPYINRWVGQLLRDPANIQCAFTSATTVPNPTTVTVADLGLQPIDLLFLANDEIINDESELAQRVRRYARSRTYTVGSLANQRIGRSEKITIDFHLAPNKSPSIISFEEMLSVLKSSRDIITSCRSLRTTDYVAPTEAAAEVNEYDNGNFYTSRLLATKTDFETKLSLLDGELQNVLSATLAPSLATLKGYVHNLSWYGLEQTVYEYFPDETAEDFTAITQRATAISKEAHARLTSYQAIFPPTPAPTVPTSGDDAFINKCLQGYKALFGRAFIALPRFKLRAADQALLNAQLSTDPTTTLLRGHASNPYVMDEWLCGISKVRKNTANYEFLSALASGINLDAFTDDRKLFPAQVPYNASSSTDRWLGSTVNNDAALQEGRVAFAISIPGGSSSYSMGTYEVGLMIDEWVDVIPNKNQTTGIAFHANQPNQKPPQCLLLGLTPRITGSWNWADIVDMINETFDLAKTRGVSYDSISGTPVGQLSPTLVMPFSATNSTIALTSPL
ncbi:hypothetical protein IC235_18410 [Hymenobacter sp. BT664]|uniref:Uncharacterized protein n=1 Tax=Hymenobacter montanus TaxID=2771359 RepID=A0A927BFE5_9BACT|nr:hypothetical protein [Hymenobacter montanus]MBD2769867.1 hypothetical protein [Hymenobacter montanus]